MRSLRLLLTIAITAAITASCVSRNVETISDEDAAAMASPRTPQTSQAQPPAVAISEAGFAVSVSVGADVSTVPDGILFVVVRVAGRAGGPPLAVKRLPADLPVEFTVTAADSMIAGTPLVDAMDVTVRLDQDGDAMSREAGDLSATIGPVAVGDTIELVLGPIDPATVR